MVMVTPTVLDVARSVARLDEHADTPARGTVNIDGIAWTRDELRASVAGMFAYHLARHNAWGGRRNVTTRDVRAMLIASGASPFTVEQHARAIASRIRADFSDGMR